MCWRRKGKRFPINLAQLLLAATESTTGMMVMKGRWSWFYLPCTHTLFRCCIVQVYATLERIYKDLSRVYFLPKYKKGLKKNARDNRAPSTVGKYLPSSFCTFFTCKSLAVWKVAMKQVRKQCISPSLCTGKGYINWARQIVKQVCFMVFWGFRIFCFKPW